MVLLSDKPPRSGLGLARESTQLLVEVCHLHRRMVEEGKARVVVLSPDVEIAQEDMVDASSLTLEEEEEAMEDEEKTLLGGFTPGT